jgi:hypothetical protein
MKTPDPSIINVWGKEMLFAPASEDTEYVVTMVRDDEAPEGDGIKAPLMVLFGTMADSGFTDQGAPLPVRNDRMIVDGVEYRVYEVKRDFAGGRPGSARSALWLYLEWSSDAN